MEKKKYYKVENGDGYIIYHDLKEVFSQIDTEIADEKETDEPTFWVVSAIFLTDKEFEELPEAD